MLKRIGLLCLVFILLVSIVSASSPFVAQVLPPRDAVDPCSPAQFRVLVTNIGEFQDTYFVDIDDEEAFLDLQPPVLTLNPNGEGAIKALVTYPCNVYGRKSPSLTLSVKDTDIKEEFKAPFTIIPNDIPIIAGGVKTVASTYQKSAVELTIQNIGSRSTTYFLNVEGEPWVTVQPLDVVVPARSSKNFKLIIDPNDFIPEDEYVFTIVAKVDETSVEYVKDVTIDLAHPSALKTFFENYGRTILISIISIIVLIILFVLIRYVLDKTSDYRAKKREDRKKRREEKKAEKEKKKQEKLEQRAVSNEQKEKDREVKAVALAAKKEERDAAKRLRREERDAKKKSKFMDLALSALIANLCKTHKQIPRNGKKSKKPVLLFFFFVLLIILGVVSWWFWEKLRFFMLPIWIIIGVLFFLFVVVSLLRSASRKKSLKKLSEEELALQEAKAFEVLLEEYILIPKSELKSWKKKTKTGAFKRFLLFVLFVAAVAGGIALVFLTEMIEEPIMLFVIAGLLFLILVFSIVQAKKKMKKSFFPIISPSCKAVISTSWKKGLGEVIFCANSVIDGTYLAVKRENDNPVFIKPEGEILQYFTIFPCHVAQNELDTVTFRFKARKSWMKNRNIKHEDMRLVHYEADLWEGDSIPPTIINEDKRFVYYEISRDKLTSFAIIGKPSEPEQSIAATAPIDVSTNSVDDSDLKVKPKKVKAVKKVEKVEPLLELDDESDSKSFWLRLLFAIIIALLLGAVAYYFFVMPSNSSSEPIQNTDDQEELDKISNDIDDITSDVAGISDEEVEEPGIPKQSMKEGNSIILDLGKYFIDPDGDPLKIENSKLEHFTITYDGQVANISSVAGFTGKEKVIFTVTDNDGRSVSSNAITLESTKKSFQENLTNMVSLKELALIAVLIILLIVLIFSLHKRLGKDNSEE